MAAVEVYSLAADGNRKLSEHFNLREFRCADGTDPVFVDPALVELLERIRAHFGRPVKITSSYRTVAHNAKIGGSAKSQHCLGRAADIKVEVVSPSDVYAYAETLLGDTGGLGLYKSWVHIDTRPTKSRWRG